MYIKAIEVGPWQLDDVPDQYMAQMCIKAITEAARHP